MHKLRNSIIALTGLLSAIGLIALVMPRTGVSQNTKPPQDVRIVATTVNVPVTAGTPLPVTGNISISNTPTVGIDASANAVRVENSATPLLVRDVSMAERQPFVYYGSQALPEGQSEVTAEAFAVPPGKRCVIEYVNLEVNAPGEFGASVFLHAPFGAAQIKYNLLTRPNEAPYGILVSQQVRIYIEPGQTQLRFRRTPPMGQETIFDFVLSGYLEPIQ